MGGALYGCPDELFCLRLGFGGPAFLSRFLLGLRLHLLGFRFQFFISGFTVDCLLIMSEQDRFPNETSSLLRVEGAQSAMGRIDQRAFHDGRSSLLVQNGYERFSDSQFRDGFDDIEFWVGAEGLGSDLHTLLIFGSERPEGMLYPISELS